MSLPSLLLCLSTVAAGGAPAQPVDDARAYTIRLEGGAGFGLLASDLQLAPFARGGVLFEVGAPNLLIGGDLALGLALPTESQDNAFVSVQSFELLAVPRAVLGYRVPLDAIALIPHGYLALVGGARVTTTRVFGREESETTGIVGGRLGLGVSLSFQVVLVSLELFTGLRDRGLEGGGALALGVLL